MAGRLKGKVAIVTGAASVGPGLGNGKATAMLFAREGAKVLLVNRSEPHAEELRREIAHKATDLIDAMLAGAEEIVEEAEQIAYDRRAPV